MGQSLQHKKGMPRCLGTQSHQYKQIVVIAGLGWKVHLSFPWPNTSRRNWGLARSQMYSWAMPDGDIEDTTGSVTGEGIEGTSAKDAVFSSRAVNLDLLATGKKPLS